MLFLLSVLYSGYHTTSLLAVNHCTVLRMKCVFEHEFKSRSQTLKQLTKGNRGEKRHFYSEQMYFNVKNLIQKLLFYRAVMGRTRQMGVSLSVWVL